MLVLVAQTARKRSRNFPSSDYRGDVTYSNEALGIFDAWSMWIEVNSRRVQGSLITVCGGILIFPPKCLRAGNVCLTHTKTLALSSCICPQSKHLRGKDKRIRSSGLSLATKKV